MAELTVGYAGFQPLSW